MKKILTLVIINFFTANIFASANFTFNNDPCAAKNSACDMTIQAFADPSTICANTSTTIFADEVIPGAPVVTYNWSHGLGSGYIKTVSPSMTTTYSVTATDGNGCTATASITVTMVPNFNVTIAGKDSSCADKKSIFTANTNGGKAPLTYIWSNNMKTKSIQVDKDNTYSVTVTDKEGCSNVASKNYINLMLPIVTTSNDQIICEGSSTLITAYAEGGSGTYTFTWNNNIGKGAAKIVAPTIETKYIVTVTDSKSCSSSDELTIKLFNKASIDITGPSSLCSGNDVTWTAQVTKGTPPYSYHWSTKDTNSVIKLFNPGIYSLTVRDANNCSVTLDKNLSELASPVLNIGADISVCAMDTVVVTSMINGGLAPYILSWNQGLANGNSHQIIPTNSMEIIAKVTDANTCFDIDTLQIHVKQIMPPQLISDSILCFGNKTTIHVLGVYDTYLWNTGDTSQSLEVNQGGKYILSVSKNKCTASTSTDIVYNPEIEINFTTINQQIMAEVKGGTKPYKYQWNTGDTTSMIPYHTGTFTLRVIDANNCELEKMFIITDTQNKYYSPYFNFYPNPASGLLKVETNEKNYTLNLYNISGDRVYSVKNAVEIQVDKFPRGIYYIQLKSASNMNIAKLLLH